MGPWNDVKVFDLWSLSVKDQILKTKKLQQIFFYQHKKIFDPKRHRVTFLKQKIVAKQLLMTAAYGSCLWQLLVTADVAESQNREDQIFCQKFAESWADFKGLENEDPDQRKL